MTIRYSYEDFTTKGHGVIEGIWGKKNYQKKELTSHNVSNVPDNLMVKQKSKDYFSLKIPGRSLNGTLMKNVKVQIDAGRTIKLNDTYYIRKNSAEEYVLLTKSKKNKKNNANKPKLKNSNSLSANFAHLMRIHNDAKKK